MPYTDEQINRILSYSEQPTTRAYPTTRPTYAEFIPESLKEIGRGAEKFYLSATLPMIDPDIAEQNRREAELARIQSASEQYEKRFTSPKAPGTMRLLAKDVIPNIGYSVGMSGPVVAASVAGSPLLGLITAAGMLHPALRSLRRQKMDDLERTTRQRIEPILGRKITDDEWNREIERHDYATLAKKSAAYEVYPELIGSVALGLIFKAGGPFARKAVTKVVGRIAPKAGQEVGEILAKPGIISAFAGGVGVFTETQLEEQITELYTNYNQARLDWEHGLAGEPADENPYSAVSFIMPGIPTSIPKLAETLKQQAIPVGLTTITMGAVLGGGATAVDIHNVNKMRRDFKFDNADMRKSVINKIWNGLNETKNSDVAIKSAEALRDKYGKEQNPELWTALDNIISAFRDYDATAKTGDSMMRERAFNRFELLRSDEALSKYGNLGDTTETKHDISRILTKLKELAQADGVNVAIENANILRENASELGLTDTVNSIDRFINSSRGIEKQRVKAVEKEIIKQQTSEQNIAAAIQDAAQRINQGEDVWDVIAETNKKKNIEKARKNKADRARIEAERVQIVGAIQDVANRMKAEEEIGAEIPLGEGYAPPVAEAVVPAIQPEAGIVEPTVTIPEVEKVVPEAQKPTREAIPVEPTAEKILSRIKYRGKMYNVVKTPEGNLFLKSKTATIPYSYEQYDKYISRVEAGRKAIGTRLEDKTLFHPDEFDDKPALSVLLGAGLNIKSGTSEGYKVSGELRDLFDGVMVGTSGVNAKLPYDPKGKSNTDDLVYAYNTAIRESGEAGREFTLSTFNELIQEAHREMGELYAQHKSFEKYGADQLTYDESVEYEQLNKYLGIDEDFYREKLRNAIPEEANKIIDEIVLANEQELNNLHKEVRENEQAETEEIRRNIQESVKGEADESGITEEDVNQAIRELDEYFTTGVSTETFIETAVEQIPREKLKEVAYRKPKELNEIVNNKPLLSDEDWNSVPDVEKKAIMGNLPDFIEMAKAWNRNSPAMIRDMNDGSSFSIKITGDTNPVKSIGGELYQRRQDTPIPDHTTAMFNTFDSVTGTPIKEGDSVWFFEDGRILLEDTFTFLPDVVKQGTLFDMQVYLQSKGKKANDTVNKVTPDDTNLVEQSQNPDTQSNIFTDEELQAMTKDPNQTELFSEYTKLSGDYIPLPMEMVNDIVNKVTKVFANKPNIKVIDNIYQPTKKENLEKLKSIGTLGNPNSTIVGLFDPIDDTVYLSTRAMRNETDVVEAILHETIGHYGLRNVIGKQLEPVLKQAYNYYKTNNPDKLNKIADLYGFDLEKNSKHRMQTAEELLVDAVINPQEAPIIHNRVITVIKNFINRILRAIGISPTEKTITINSEKDIINLAERARDYVLGQSRLIGAPKNITGRNTVLMPETILNNSDIFINEFNDIVASIRDNNEHHDIEKIKGEVIVRGIEKLYQQGKKKPTIKQNKQIFEARDRIKWFDKKYDNDMLNEMYKTLNAIANRKFGDSRKKDIPLIQWIAGSPEYVKNIPSFEAFIKLAYNSSNVKRLLHNQMLGEELGEGNALTRLVKWGHKKGNEKEYAQMGEVWFENDRNKTDYAREETKKTTQLMLDIIDENLKEMPDLNKIDRMNTERQLLENQRKDKTKTELQRQGFSESAIQIWLDIRDSYDRALETFIRLGKITIKNAKKENMAIPTILFDDSITGTSYKVNLMDSVREMAEMRGWYAPRLRQPGRFGLRADAEGLSPVLKYFTTKIQREKFKLDLIEQGYDKQHNAKFEYRESEELPDTFNVYENILGIEKTIEEVLGRMDFTFYESLDKIKGLDTRTVDYVKVDGTKEQHFIVDMDGDKYSEVFKNIGGKRYEEQSGSGNLVWHFTDTKNIKDRVLNGINTDYKARRTVSDDFAIRLLSNTANLIKSGSWRATTIKRGKEVGAEVVRGYEEDLIKSSGTYFSRTSAGLAKSEVAQQLMEAISGFYDRSGKKYERADFHSDEEFVDFIRENRINPIIQRRAYNHAHKTLESLLSSNTFVENAMSFAKSMMIIKYLAGTIASPFVNVTSMVTSVAPSMNQYAKVPWKQIPMQLMKGAKYYIEYRFGRLKNIPDDVIKLLKKLDEASLDRAQYYNDQLAWLKSKEGAWAANMANKLMWIFEQSERFNRGATIIGTYDYINKHNTKKLSFDELVEQSEEISNKAHGIYDKSTAPFWAQGKTTLPVVSRGMYTFMKFSHNYMQNMAEMFLSSETTKKEKMMNVGWMMFAPMVLGGIGAIPLAGAVDDLDEMVGNPLEKSLNKIFNTDDYMGDFYRAVEENFGTTADRIAHDGVIGAVTPVTVRGSLAVEVPDPTETAPWSLVKDIGYGFSDIKRGDILRGSERLLPRFIASFIRAIREAKYGATTRTGAPIFYGTEQIKPTAGETALRMLSFSPVMVTRKKEEVYKAQTIKRKYDERRTDIYARYRRYLQKSTKDRTTKELAKIMKMRKDYNDDVRERRKTDKRYLGISLITNESFRRAVGSMRRVPKIERGRAMEEITVGRGEIY